MGQADGSFYATPEFVYFGPRTNEKTKKVTTADVNGDGLSDVIIANNNWDSGGNNTGGLALILGRSNSANPNHKTEVICEAEFIFNGFRANDNFAHSLTGVGDINDDGCEEFAAGAKESDQQANNGGEIRIFWGFGKAGCPSDITITSLASGVGTSRGGSALAGGHDIDGDNIPDIAVGGEDFETADGTDTGIVWLISGDFLRGLASQNEAETTSAPVFHSFGPALTDPQLRIVGTDLEERFGASLIMVPNLESDGRAGILVGHPGSWELDYANAGGASLYRFELNQPGPSGKFSNAPYLRLSGETSSWGSELGLALSAMNHTTGALITVGGYWGLGTGVDQGSAYVIPVTLP